MSEMNIDLFCGFVLENLPFKMTSSYGNIFCVTGHLCGEFPGSPVNSRTKASDAEL